MDSVGVYKSSKEIGGVSMGGGLQEYNTMSKIGEWSDRVRACRSSGMTVKAWCTQNGLSEKTYYYWQRKVFQASTQEETRFVEITENGLVESTTAATIQANGLLVRIHNGADRETLAALLQAMRSC